MEKTTTRKKKKSRTILMDDEIRHLAELVKDYYAIESFSQLVRFLITKEAREINAGKTGDP